MRLNPIGAPARNLRPICRSKTLPTSRIAPRSQRAAPILGRPFCCAWRNGESPPSGPHRLNFLSSERPIKVQPDGRVQCDVLGITICSYRDLDGTWRRCSRASTKPTAGDASACSRAPHPSRPCNDALLLSPTSPTRASSILIPEHFPKPSRSSLPPRRSRIQTVSRRSLSHAAPSRIGKPLT
jgi:hypothetical protein